MTGSDSADDSADNLKLVVKKAHPLTGRSTSRYRIIQYLAARATSG